MIIQTLVYIYGFILLMSSIFTFFLYTSYKEVLLKQLLYFWLSGLISFVFQGLFNKDDVWGFLAFASHVPSIYFLLKIYYGLGDARLPIKRFSGILFTGLLISLICFSLNLDFALSSAFFCGSVVVIFLKSIIWNIKLKNQNPLFKGLSLLLFLNALHFADYPIIRPNPDMAVLGFSIALGFYFIYSIYIPLFVIKKTSDSYSTALEKQVQSRTYEIKEANELLSLKNNELMVLNKNIEVVSKENQMLLNILVHDISNPVQVIIAFVDKASRVDSPVLTGSLSGRVKMALNTILETLNTVKNYHSVRVGKIVPKISKFDVVETIESVAFQFEDKIKAKNLELDVFVKPGTETVLASDRTWVKNQIVSNILSNAIKFSYTNGKIVIGISSVEKGINISFRDFGPGIPEGAKENLFSSMTATTTLGTDGETGTGLGMPIVKDYIIRLNGSVEVVDLPPGENGTCFNVYLPYEFLQNGDKAAS